MAQDFGVNEWVVVGSAGLAALSLLLNFAVVRRQTGVQFEALKAQTDAQVLAWADAAIDALSEAAFVAKGRGALAEETMRARVQETMRTLSATADKGRLFFPNLGLGDHNTHNEGAFRGRRPPVLDCLIFAYHALERLDPRNLGPDAETSDFIERCRRVFVSEIQRAVDPRRRSRMMRALASQASRRGDAGIGEVADLGRRLEARHPGILLERREDAWMQDMAKHSRADS